MTTTADDSGNVPEPSAHDRKQSLIVKRAGQSCIAMFVVFVIVLFAFGKAPLTRTIADGNSRVDLNFISCLGIGMGVYALLFLLLCFRAVLQLSTAKKALGLIGAIGLIVHSLLAVFVPLSNGQPTRAAGTGGLAPMAQKGPEQWLIGGKTYRVESTYYLALPEGLQYTIEHPWTFRPAEGEMNDERALQIAFPLMKHAYEQGLYKRATIRKAGGGVIAPSRIGVTLLERRGREVKGYRIALSLDEIRKRIRQVPPSTTQAAGDLP